MRTRKIGKHDVVIYDSIDELPIVRFHKYNKMLLIDAGIGSDLADFDAHIQKALAFIKSKPESAAVELDNLRQNVYMIQEELSPRFLAFACLVSEIDGKPCNDLTDEALKNIVQTLSNASVAEIATEISEVKKKIDAELDTYFPSIFDDASVKEYYDQLRRRTLIVLDGIINGESEKQREELARITKELMEYAKPKEFSGSNNLEIQHDKNFNRMCISLSQYVHIDPKGCSVMEFYNAYEYVNEMLKAKVNAYKSRKA